MKASAIALIAVFAFSILSRAEDSVVTAVSKDPFSREARLKYAEWLLKNAEALHNAIPHLIPEESDYLAKEEHRMSSLDRSTDAYLTSLERLSASKAWRLKKAKAGVSELIEALKAVMVTEGGEITLWVIVSERLLDQTAYESVEILMKDGVLPSRLDSNLTPTLAHAVGAFVLEEVVRPNVAKMEGYRVEIDGQNRSYTLPPKSVNPMSK